MKRDRLALPAAAVLALALTVPARAADTHLLIIGGGDHPPAAMARLVEWSGGAAARLLVIPWASVEPKESCDELIGEMKQHGAGEAVCAPFTKLDDKGNASPLDPASLHAFEQQLARATGVYFTGGDQVRIMAVLAADGLREAVRARHAAGVAMAGTSAGAAIMSERMITGEGDFTVIDGTKVEIKQGLGLLPGAIVDQHFVKRQRENRLFGVVLLHPEERGVGINEATALLVTNGTDAEVMGAGPVMLVDAKGPDQLLVTLVRAGQKTKLR
jgi:cyanophycinase